MLMAVHQIAAEPAFEILTWRSQEIDANCVTSPDNSSPTLPPNWALMPAIGRLTRQTRDTLYHSAIRDSLQRTAPFASRSAMVHCRTGGRGVWWTHTEFRTEPEGAQPWGFRT